MTVPNIWGFIFETIEWFCSDLQIEDGISISFELQTIVCVPCVYNMYSISQNSAKLNLFRAIKYYIVVYRHP